MRLSLLTLVSAGAALNFAPGGRTQHSRRTVAPACTVDAPQPAGLSTLLQPSTVAQRLIFVGGKGGVGKTSTSSSIAVRLADSGLSTLIVSTDPAHSLSDALMQDVGGGKPVVVNGVEGLEAMEVSTEEAAERFRSAIGGFRASDLGLGSVAEELVSKLGLDDLADVLDSIPPGLDELLALAEVLALVQPSGADGAAAAGGTGGEMEGLSATAKGFDRIVLDTAPTGHTLRLLAFPVFLDNLLTKLISLRSRLQGAVALLGALSGVENPAAKIDNAVEKLRGWQARVENLQSLLTDPEVTDFVVVAIPSRLSVAESARLLSSLVSQDVPVSQLVVNQIIAQDATAAYLGRVVKEQQRALQTIESGSSPLSRLQLSRVPFFDLEIRGVFPLKFLGGVAFGGEHEAIWEDTLKADGDRFVFVGGKGGVGKTTTSAALAVACAEAGHNTLLVSTDPAHSLGDALDVELSGGAVARVEGIVGASLYAVEVEVDEAVQEFKRLVGGVADGGGAKSEGGLGLSDFADIFDAVPPGVDELVALAKLVRLARRDELGMHFDRVIVDTAPTGHTLRLLTYPDFLDRFIERLLAIRKRFDAASSVFDGAGALLGRAFGGDGKPSDAAATQNKAVAALVDFQAQMQDLQALLHDEGMTEFCIVTIPTGLAIAESERLLIALEAEGIAVRRAVLNRLINEEQAAQGEGGYLTRLSKGQLECRTELADLATRCDVTITEVPLFDMEVRAPPGLRAMGSAMFDGDAKD